MSDEQLYLLPLGGLHAGDSSDRFELAKQKFDTVDTVFIESFIGDESLHTILISGLKAPLVVPGVLLSLKFIGLLTYFIGDGDRELKQRIVDEYDAEVVVVDRSFQPSVDAAPYLWPISNYAVFFGIYVLYTEFFGLTFAIITVAYITLSTFLFYLAASLYGRDSKIALDIEQYAQRHSGNACAIIGGHHQKGIINKLMNSSIVQIVSQDN